MNSELPFVCIQRLDSDFFDECFAQSGIETLISPSCPVL